jgi:hypothetical protein
MNWEKTTDSGVSGQAAVELYGGIEGTHMGWTLFEADRLLKGLFIAEDTLTEASVQPTVPGYISLIDRHVSSGNLNAFWARKWFEPERVTLAKSTDGSAMLSVTLTTGRSPRICRIISTNMLQTPHFLRTIEIPHRGRR